eukprot:1190288-Prorocentrum_minimum.AAC.1
MNDNRTTTEPSVRLFPAFERRARGHALPNMGTACPQPAPQAGRRGEDAYRAECAARLLRGGPAEVCLARSCAGSHQLVYKNRIIPCSLPGFLSHDLSVNLPGGGTDRLRGKSIYLEGGPID